MPHIERLTQLARVVRAAPEALFVMRNFEENTSCGTAHCAAGWAQEDPWFIAQGISKSADALGYFFGLSRREAEMLFALDCHPRDIDPHAITKEEVLSRIEALLRGEEIEPYDAVLAAGVDADDMADTSADDESY